MAGTHNSIYNTLKSSHSFVEASTDDSIKETERLIANALIGGDINIFNSGCVKKPNIKCVPKFKLTNTTNHSHLMISNEENECNSMFAIASYNNPRALPDSFNDTFAGKCGKYGPNNATTLYRTVRRDISSNSFYNSKLVFTTDSSQNIFFDNTNSRFIVTFNTTQSEPNSNNKTFNIQKAVNSRYSVIGQTIDPLTISECVDFNKNYSLYSEKTITRDPNTNKLTFDSSNFTNNIGSITYAGGGGVQTKAYTITVNQNSKISSNVSFGAIKVVEGNNIVTIYKSNTFIGDPNGYSDWSQTPIVTYQLSDNTLKNIISGVNLPAPFSFITIKRNIPPTSSATGYFVIPPPQFLVTAISTLDVTTYPHNGTSLTNMYFDINNIGSTISYYPFTQTGSGYGTAGGEPIYGFNNIGISFKNSNIESFYNLKYNPTYVSKTSITAKSYGIYIPSNKITIDFYPAKSTSIQYPNGDYTGVQKTTLYSGLISDLVKYVSNSKNTNTYMYSDTNNVKHINYIEGSIDTATNLYSFSFTQPFITGNLSTVTVNNVHGVKGNELLNIKITNIIPFMNITYDGNNPPLSGNNTNTIELGVGSCLQTYLYGTSYNKDEDGNITFNIVRYESDVGLSNLVWPGNSLINYGILKPALTAKNFCYPAELKGDLATNFNITKFGIWPIRKRYKTFTLYSPSDPANALSVIPYNFMDVLSKFIKAGGISSTNWLNQDWITCDTAVWSPWLLNGGSVPNIWSPYSVRDGAGISPSYNILDNTITEISSKIPNVLKYRLNCLSTIGQSIMSNLFCVSRNSPYRAIVCQYSPVLSVVSGDGNPIVNLNAFGIEKLIKNEMKYFLIPNVEYSSETSFDYNFNFILNGISL